MSKIGQRIAHIHGFRAQRLFARKREQLPYQRGRAVRVLVDLNQITIVAVAWVMSKQQQITMS